MTPTLFLLSLACSHPDPSPSTPAADSTALTDDTATIPPVDADGDGAAADVDCDDGDPEIHPNATETCNGIDDDCDDMTDEDAVDALTLYTDADGDGYGGKSVTTCDASAGIVDGGDCDDADASVHPGACDEPVDGRDTDCDGVGDTEIPVEVSLLHAQCSRLEEWQTAETGPVALRVVATTTDQPYDSRAVHVTASKPTILVLSSQSAIKWVVDETVAGTVQHIIVSSRDASTAEGPEGVPIDLYSGSSQALPYYPDWNNYLHTETDEKLFDLTGVHVTSWAGCDAFEEITVADGDEWPASTFEYASRTCPLDETPFSDPDLSVLPEACQPLVAKGIPVCLTTGIYGTYLYDLDGDTCQIQHAGISSHYPEVSLGWRGAHLYTCDPETLQLVRMSLVDGRIERSRQYCMGTTDWGDKILSHDVFRHGFYYPVWEFGSWAEVQSEPDPVALVSDADWGVMATTEDVMYIGSRNEIARISLDPPKPLSQIRVEDFDDINGLDVTADDVIVAQDFYLDRTAYLFDLDGTQLGSFELPFESSGVSCFTP